MSKCFKICEIFAIFVLWACSSDESPTGINAGQNTSGQENIPLSQSAEVVFSSSSGSFNPGTPVVESSSSIAEKGKNEKFMTVEVQVFQESKNGEFYLLQLMKYSNYNLLSDSVYSCELEIISYDENGRETSHTTGNNSMNGDKTSYNGTSHYYKYVEGEQINYKNDFSETESIIDIETNWVVYYHSKYKTITDDSQVESEGIQITTKELISSSNDGKEYILRTTQDGKANTSYIKLILDASGFKTKTITYDSNNSFLSGNAFLKMPNAPESLSKVSVCYQPFFEGTSPYEYYNVSCKDVVNTSETYQLVVESSSKMKNYDNVTRLKYIYTYNRFEY